MDNGKKKILVVLNKKTQCGVHEFGLNIFAELERSQEYDFIKAECGSLEEYLAFKKQHQPAIVLFNYYPSIMPWVVTKVALRIFGNNVYAKNEIHIGIIHEATQAAANAAIKPAGKYFFNKNKILHNTIFDYYIAPDPGLLLQNPIVYKTGRLVPAYHNTYPLPQVPVIGSFGLATHNKGFELIVKKVQEEFDEAIIRINMPLADAMKDSEVYAKELSAKCNAALYKKGVRLEITHDFLSPGSLLNFIAQNSINVLLYQDYSERGLSSTVDYALAVQRPIAVSKSGMFRHILNTKPTVCLEDSSLRQIMDNGVAALKKYQEEWNAANLLWEYERIIGAVLKKEMHGPAAPKRFIKSTRSKIRRLFSLPDKSFVWLRNTNRVTDDVLDTDQAIVYHPVQLSAEDRFNRILDNAARILYKPAIDKLFELVPKTMAKKIPEANVQQAFVFDTVYRNLSQYNEPKILCVGSYEDTASMGLIKMGFNVEEIDPMINYFLQEYYTKPGTQKGFYNIIFSTSVIEHDPDDQSFMECIYGLLAPGGIAVITCDYKDQWKPGDPKPDVDARFYTQKDLKERLLRYMPGCSLVDEPKWDCPNPDFNYLGIYQYTFATFVVKKNY
jgi:SAM-dependent methyltransferase